MRLETRSSDRNWGEMQVGTPDQNNQTMNNVNTVIQNSLGEDEIRPQLIEPSQVSDEILV